MARLNVLHAALRQPGNNSSILHELAQSIPRCDVVSAATRQEAALRSRRAQARCTQPLATLSTRKRSRRPREYLTPLLTAEAGQQWGRKDGATTMCLEPCIDRTKKKRCVLRAMTRHVLESGPRAAYQDPASPGSRHSAAKQLDNRIKKKVDARVEHH